MRKKKKLEGIVVSPDDSYEMIKKNLIEMLKKPLCKMKLKHYISSNTAD